MIERNNIDDVDRCSMNRTHVIIFWYLIVYSRLTIGSFCYFYKVQNGKTLFDKQILKVYG